MAEEVLQECAVCENLIVMDDATRSIEWRFSTENNNSKSIVFNVNLVEILLHRVY